MDHPIVEPSTKDFKVVLVGGGLCGLALAVGLLRAGVDVEIFEAARRFGEVGAGVGLGPNALRALKELGIIDDVLAKSDQREITLRSFLFVTGDGAHEEIYDYPVRPDDFGLGMHRAAFLDALVHHIDISRTHFGKRCTSISPSSSHPTKMTISFADGSTTEADVVLGADGIKSSVRNYVLDAEEPGTEKKEGFRNAIFSNTICYRGLVPMERLKGLLKIEPTFKRPVCWVGSNKHIITYPIRGGETLNIAAFVCDRSTPMGANPLPEGQPWVSPRTKAEMLAEYEGMGPDVQAYLGFLESPSVWSIHIVDPLLQTYCRGRVAILGDAAHGMLPHHGAGAGQALEDALMLARLLGHPQTNKSNIEHVLKVYDKYRRPRANMVLTSSTRAGDIYQGCGPSGPGVENIRNDLLGHWEKIWHHDLLDDIDAAIKDLQADGVFS